MEFTFEINILVVYKQVKGYVALCGLITYLKVKLNVIGS